ncbi:MAG: glycosyltransferase family 39 protein [Vicinamibacterales bacterium]
MPRSPWRPSRAVLVVLVAAGIVLRGYGLGSPSLWVDEAESSINALTIVADGAPRDRFLDLPLYENTLVKPWPGNPEYEFRDLSYSDRGLAVYHSWIPLYAIAAAFRLSGVTPEQARLGTPFRDGSDAEFRHWTAVPRLPAVVFGAVAILAAWALGRRMAGGPGAVALALALATADVFVSAGRQARYYSAQIAVCTIGGLAVWQAWRRGRFLDHALAGLAVGVLFHVHSVSAVALSGLYVLAAPLGRDQPRVLFRMVVAGAAGALLIVPWALWSGMLQQASWVPPTRSYLRLQMLIASLPSNPLFWLPVLAAAGWLVAARAALGARGDEWHRAYVEHRDGLYFGVAWLAVAYLAFFLLMPAASAFRDRLHLITSVPLVVVTVVVSVAAGQALRPGTRFVPAMLTLMVLASWGQLPLRLPSAAGETSEAARYRLIREWRLSPGARVFATPNDHLVFTYYGNRPVQSIAPVRREWLESFPGDLVILEGGRYSMSLTAESVRHTAQGLGQALDHDTALARARFAPMAAAYLDLEAAGVTVQPLPRAIDALDRALVDQIRTATRARIRGMLSGMPLGHDFSMSHWQDFRDGFFYWFVNPPARTGEHLNYRSCRDRAVAAVLPGGLAVLDCRRVRDTPLVPAQELPAS